MSEKFITKQKFTSRVVCEKKNYSLALQSVFDNPDSFLCSSTTPVLQDNFKSRIGVIDVDGKKLVIKRHNYKSRWQQFKRYFRRTKSSRSWYFSQLLIQNKISIPHPIAYIEKRIGPLRGMSYFLYEYVEGIQGEEYLKSMSHSPKEAAHVIASILEVIDTMQDLQLIHGDIRLANFIFSKEKLYLLDFDDVRPRSWYKPPSMKNRDIRGFRKDLCYNAPEILQDQLLEQIDQYCITRGIMTNWTDYRNVSS